MAKLPEIKLSSMAQLPILTVFYGTVNAFKTVFNGTFTNLTLSSMAQLPEIRLSPMAQLPI